VEIDMTKKSRGFRAKTRRKLKQRPDVRPSIMKFLREFDLGQQVVLLPEPSSHRGMPHPRFKGKSGKIIDKRGKAYIVQFTDGNKIKKVIVRPEHLKVA
jgi:large subunit ribosomal protein L21e